MKQKLIENVSQITCGLTCMINPWPVCSLVFFKLFSSRKFNECNYINRMPLFYLFILYSIEIMFREIQLRNQIQ